MEPLEVQAATAPAKVAVAARIAGTATKIGVKLGGKPLQKYFRARTITKLRGWSLVLFLANAVWFFVNVFYVVSSFFWVGLDANWTIQFKMFTFDFSRLISGVVYGAIALLGILSAIIHHPIIALGYMFGLTLSLLLAIIAYFLNIFAWGFLTSLTGGPLALVFFIIFACIIASCCVFTFNSPLFCCCCCSALQLYYMQKWKMMKRSEKKLKAQPNEPSAVPSTSAPTAADMTENQNQSMDFSAPPLSQNPYDEIAKMQQQQQSIYTGNQNEGSYDPNGFLNSSETAGAETLGEPTGPQTAFAPAFSSDEKKMADEFYN